MTQMPATSFPVTPGSPSTPTAAGGCSELNYPHQGASSFLTVGAEQVGGAPPPAAGRSKLD